MHRRIAPGQQAEAPGLSHGPVHLFVNGIEGGHLEQAAADARLIGRDDHAKTGLREFRNGLQATRNGSPFLGALDVGIAVVVNDPVAIEDDQFHREMRNVKRETPT